MEKKQKDMKPKTGLARCLEIASDRQPMVILSAVLSSLAAVASFIPYLAIYGVIKEILSVYPKLDLLDTHRIMLMAWTALGGILLNIVMYFLAILFSHLAAFGTIYELKTAFAKHLTQIPLGYHMNIGSGKLRKIMEDNIDSIEGFIAHQFPDFTASVTAPIVMVVILLAINIKLGLISLAGIVLAFVAEFIGYGSKDMKHNMEQYQNALESMNNASVEFVRGMPVIKAFGRERSSFAKLKKAIADYTDWVLKFSLGWQNCMPAFTAIINNIYLLLIPVGLIIMRSDSGKGFLMDFIFYLLFTPAAAGVMNKIMYVSESFMQVNGSVERMDEVMNIRELSDTRKDIKLSSCDIEFRNVSFSYDEDQQKVLDNVSFKIKEGSLTAVVGRSGSGKSTIANLISRFYDTDSGQVLIGGHDIKDIGVSSLMEQVSFVYQDIFLFRMSIADNISLGKKDASREQIIEAAKLAHCHEFIKDLPDGYDTVIGSSGIHLSGGERQRISIARAILKDAPIVVLDEATAFSDPENEYLIKQSFRSLMKGKTVIMIAHRLGSIKDADNILVMNNGVVAEQGTHDELIGKGGRYKTMWESYEESMQWKVGGAAV
ncbi:MAG: ABC transporter ATP-binding protein [Oscillospiraceae bacterium]|nr:ABC transporter ATP-binding protein [Oscillospiraceae bacterium]